jgi:N-glycosylase/DNA lyase
MVVVIRETPTTTLYRPLTTIAIPKNSSINNNNCCNTYLHERLWNYFQLDTPLEPLYKEWSKACPRLATIAKCIPGVRIINQDPWECLVSFICSSNNNIPRITQMLGRIRKEYGTLLLTIGDDDEEEYYNDSRRHSFYSFPTLDDLWEKATEEDLRAKCGMGYRAKYLLETMRILKEDKEGGEEYLRQVLCNIQDPIELQTKLCEFRGVGRKVADCVALFSLKQDDAIPVDTHVWYVFVIRWTVFFIMNYLPLCFFLSRHAESLCRNIALRDYDSEGVLQTMKSLTPSNYQLVGDLFRRRFPNRAGWAHSLLFVAELPSFRDVLPPSMIKEMDDFRLAEQEKKKKKT